MRAVVQRVNSCSLSVGGKLVSSISRGLVVYLGVEKNDQDADLDWVLKKVANLRIFPDDQDRMNLSPIDLGLGILVVPQFTLFGDVRRGYRPSFSEAEEPQKANLMYETFLKKLGEVGVKDVQGGVFGADMTIQQENRGPVTILLDSRKSTL